MEVTTQQVKKMGGRKRFRYQKELKVSTGIPPVVPVKKSTPNVTKVVTESAQAKAYCSSGPRARPRRYPRRRIQCPPSATAEDAGGPGESGGGSEAGEEVEERPRTIIRFKYSREELMALKCHPLSILRPECFDPNKNKKIAGLSVVKEFGSSGGGGSTGSGGAGGRGSWEPGERWGQEKRGRPESPPPPGNDEPAGLVLGPEKRRVGDPRERLRKEDGIVLSPQRRSFNSGCFVSGGGLAAGCGMGANPTPNAPRRPDSPLGKPEIIREGAPQIREIPTRRVGSGRILLHDRDNDRAPARSWDFERTGGGGSGPGSRVDKDGDFQAFRGLRDREALRDRDRDERYDPRDRRSFGREYERGSDKERRGGGRYSNRRDRDEEPEWFSGGPTSQHDTIELHGFEETMDESGARKAKKPAPSKMMPLKNSEKPSPAPKEMKKAPEDSAGEKERSRSPPKPPEPRSEKAKEPAPKQESAPPPPGTTPGGGQQKEDFNLEDFLKMDQDFSDITTLLAPGVFKNEQPVEAAAGSAGGGGSRFSRWFRHDSPPNQAAAEDSRRSSLQDELIGSIIKDMTEPIVAIPALGSSEAYFAPISPAAAGSSVPTEGKAGGSAMLMEMLQRGPTDKAPSIKDLEAAGRLHSVEELEAKMRQQNLGGGSRHQHQQRIDEQQAFQKLEQQAFQKLLMQVSNSSGLNDSNGAPSQSQNFLQMLSKGAQDIRPHQPPPSARPANMMSPGNHMDQGGMFGGVFPQGVTQPPPPQQQTAAQMNIPQDLVLKLLQLQQQSQQQQQHQQQHQQQQQQDALGKLLGGGGAPQGPPPQQRGGGGFGPNSLSPLPPEVQGLVNQVQPNRELLARPEAQNIIKGLRRGELTLQHLVHQLHNTGMQPRHREVVAAILKLQQQQQQQQGGGGQLHQPPVISPRTTSPHPDMHQLMVQQQQQQMRITSPLNGALCPTPGVLAPSPVPPMGGAPAGSLAVQHSGLPHRVPSPRELIAHTQQIMQTALIKKKLEEQRENFRKRQEMQRSHSPNIGAQKPSSSSPLAFTPTSVLRKMTADKDFESGMGGESKPLQQLQQQSNMMQAPHAPMGPPNMVGGNMGPGMGNMGQGMGPNMGNMAPNMGGGPPSVSMAMQQQQQQQHSQHSNWKPIEPTMPKPHQGRPIVKGNFSGQPGAPQGPPPQQQPGFYPGDMPGRGGPPHPMMGGNPQGGNMRGGGGGKMNQQPPMHHHQNFMSQPPPPQQMMHQQQQPNRGGPQMPVADASSSLNPLLQQLLMGQRSINSYTSSLAQQQQQQQHKPGPGRALRPQSMHHQGGGPEQMPLSQWFSGAGQLGAMPPIPTNNSMTLEEIERRQQASAATPVHN